MRKSERFVGMDLRDPDIDFVAMARSMGVAARRVVDPQAIAPALREAMRAGGPQLVEVMIADGFEPAAARPPR
jgi:benzoylformate decarboxylase